MKKGDNVATILRDLGATPDEAGDRRRARRARPRQRPEGRPEAAHPVAPAAPAARLQPMRVIVASDSAIEAVVALSDIGKYVAVDVQSMNNAEVADNDDDDDEDDGSGVRLYQSIYETALRNQMPRR